MERETIAICERCRGLIAQERLEECIDLSRHNEWGIALENLCSNLHEVDAAVDATTLDLIERVGTEMTLSPRNWQMLRKN